MSDKDRYQGLKKRLASPKQAWSDKKKGRDDCQKQWTPSDAQISQQK